MFIFNKENKKSINITVEDRIKASVFGFIIGDALGVPVEFSSRETLKNHKISDMEEFGTHYQPKGTWSDDSSMMIATMDGIISSNLPNIDYVMIMKNFLKWKLNGEYTPFNKVFDIGNSTSYALTKYQQNVDKGDEKNIICGTGDISSNGNGSLMRILPISIYLHTCKLPFNSSDYFNVIKIISGMTHSHIYSILGCYIYSIYVSELLNGNDKFSAYKNIQTIFSNSSIDGIEVYKRILNADIFKLKESDIRSSGYVVDTLEASIWCLLTTNSYTDAVLKAVNLGDDTDTVAAITGGLAGALYGFESLPDEWINLIQRKDYLLDITDKFINKIKKQ